MSGKHIPELDNAEGADEFLRLLKDAGLNQVDLTKMDHLGMSMNAVNRWAMGHTPFPHYAKAYLELWIKYKEALRHARKYRLEDA